MIGFFRTGLPRKDKRLFPTAIGQIPEVGFVPG